MPPVRVLVVDDAVVIRKLVTESLSGDPDVEVVGSAANGRICMQRIPQYNPEVIILDVEMPEMDGLETLKEIRKLHPKLAVIMFSTLTTRGASTTLDALAAGATDYVAKPSNTGGLAASMQQVRDELLPRIKAFARRGDGAPATPRTTAGAKTTPAHGAPSVATPPAAPSSPAISLAPPHDSGRLDAVIIGISTGGPNALHVMMKDLPANLPVPVFIVQHMPPVFTKQLAERLGTISPLKVYEAEHGSVPHPGGAWIAPGNHHMLVVRQGTEIKIALDDGPQENSCRPAADVLFRSAVNVYGNRTLAVVMTGMGKDGLRGCELVREKGGQIIVQDEATSVVWGMPGFVARAGIAERMLPLQDIGGEIARRVRMSREGRRP